MEGTTQVVERTEEEQQVSPGSTARLIRNVRKATRRRFTAEDKIRTVLEGFRKEISVSDLCRHLTQDIIPIRKNFSNTDILIFKPTRQGFHCIFGTMRG